MILTTKDKFGRWPPTLPELAASYSHIRQSEGVFNEVSITMRPFYSGTSRVCGDTEEVETEGTHNSGGPVDTEDTPEEQSVRCDGTEETTDDSIEVTDSDELGVQQEEQVPVDIPLIEVVYT